MGKSRAARKVSGPSGSARQAAKGLREATTVGEITEAFCLALFLPCWMYPSFRQLVQQEFDKLPVPTQKPVILPPGKAAPPVAAAPPPALAGPFYAWPYQWDRYSPAAQIHGPFGHEIFIGRENAIFYPPNSRFFENVFDNAAYWESRGIPFALRNILTMHI